MAIDYTKPPSFERSELAELYRDALMEDDFIRVKFTSSQGETKWLRISMKTYQQVMQTIVAAAEPAITCTSDDPTNHQGDTCPIHESED